jgi:hypothetical protein
MSSFTFPKQSRGPGHITSPAGTVTAGGVNKSVSIDALMDTADLSDPTLALTLGLEFSNDSGATWQTLASLNWVGGKTDKVTGTWAVPYIHNYSADDGTKSMLVGGQVRAFVDLPKAINFGATVTINN